MTRIATVRPKGRSACQRRKRAAHTFGDYTQELGSSKRSAALRCRRCDWPWQRLRTRCRTCRGAARHDAIGCCSLSFPRSRTKPHRPSVALHTLRRPCGERPHGRGRECETKLARQHLRYKTLCLNQNTIDNSCCVLADIASKLERRSRKKIGHAMPLTLTGGCSLPHTMPHLSALQNLPKHCVADTSRAVHRALFPPVTRWRSGRCGDPGANGRLFSRTAAPTLNRPSVGAARMQQGTKILAAAALFFLHKAGFTPPSPRKDGWHS